MVFADTHDLVEHIADEFELEPKTAEALFDELLHGGDDAEDWEDLDTE